MIAGAAWVAVTHPCLAEVECRETKDAIVARIDGAPVLTYRKVAPEGPPGTDAKYRRSGYIHPVLTPGGVEVTGDFPQDHPHHHGLFSAWCRVTFEGRKLDFWNQQAGLGIVRHEKVLGISNGGTSAVFRVRLVHEDPTGSSGPEPILTEIWTVRIHQNHTFEIGLSQRNITGSPVVISQYHYGGMAIRGPDQWVVDGNNAGVNGTSMPSPVTGRAGDFLTSEGCTAANGNHTRARWVSMHGRDAGIAVLSHPSNYRHPQPVRLPESLPYLSFSPMVFGGFTIGPGEKYAARYLFIPHDGKPDAEVLDTIWQRWTKTPCE